VAATALELAHCATVGRSTRRSTPVASVVSVSQLAREHLAAGGGGLDREQYRRLIQLVANRTGGGAAKERLGHAERCALNESQALSRDDQLASAGATE
jgi:hypothetical protein